MSANKIVPFLVNLTKIAFVEDSEDSVVCSIVKDTFEHFKKIFSLDNPLVLNDIFQLSDYKLVQESQASFDTNQCLLKISSRLSDHISHGSLQKISSISVAIKLIRYSQNLRQDILKLPPYLLQSIISDIFVLYWMPMRHVLYPITFPHQSAYFLNQVYDILSDLKIFTYLYDNCKDIQLFIYSWMQHVTFVKFTDDSPVRDELIETLKNYLVHRRTKRNMPDSSPYIHSDCDPVTLMEYFEKDPILEKPHSIAHLLRDKLFIELNKIERLMDNGGSVCWVIETLLMSLKVVNFLCESSQYMEAIVCARKIYFTTGIYFSLAKHYRRAQIKLQYEAICVLLRSMNGFIEYREAQDRQLFTVEAVQILKSISELESAYSSENLESITENLPEEELSNLSIPLQDLMRERVPFTLCTAYLHAQLASYHYAMCHYSLAYQHTCVAIDELVQKQPHPLVWVEVLRVICKLCTIKREFNLGLKVIRYAVSLARDAFGRNSLSYASMLLEYGCLLLNTDKTRMAAEIYRLGLTVILDCLPGCSVTASLALEDIAYAYYVLEYTSGNFDYALRCAEASGAILVYLGHPNCMQAASANRVKGLIIEEIAIDDRDESQKMTLLEKARTMHNASLELCKQTYGEDNIQTAKHYGNLGRLFQSMKRNAEAESMHKRAIEIKEKLLGESDFEVGLSVGHLASLYNYDMHLYEKAEALYKRSVEISLNLFGSTYSGLEYDYRGLQRVYGRLRDNKSLKKYEILFDDWLQQRQLLRTNETTEPSLLEPTAEDLDIQEIFLEYQNRNLFYWPNCSTTECEQPTTGCSDDQQNVSTTRRSGEGY